MDRNTVHTPKERHIAGKERALKPPRRAIVVLGMHRSGTSALTRVLSLIGCALPATLVPAGTNNPTGHWESWPVCQLDDQVFSAAASDYLDWHPIDPAFFLTPAWSSAITQARSIICNEFGMAPLFVMKDPRMCRLVPLWREALVAEGITAAYVLALRAPSEVAQSMMRGTYGVDCGHAILLWLRHMLEAEAATRHQERAVVTYDGLCQDWRSLIDGLGEQIGQIWPSRNPDTAEIISGFLSGGQRRHGSSGMPTAHLPLPQQVVATYAILERWALRGEDDADYAELDALRAVLDAACELFSKPLAAAIAARDAMQGRFMAASRKHALDIAEARENWLRRSFEA